MADLFPLELEDDPERPGPPPPASARWIDARDAPRSGSRDDIFGTDDGPGKWAAPAGDLTPHELVITRPLPTRPAAGRIVAAGTLELDSSSNTSSATLVGLDPSSVQAQTVAYLMLRVDGAVQIAGARDALPTQRATFGLTGGDWIVLPHIAGVYVFRPSAAATVSWLVVGGLD